MRLTTLTDYALRLLMYVAQQPDRLCTIAEVAQVYGISEAHLMKVTHLLGQQGWITTEATGAWLDALAASGPGLAALAGGIGSLILALRNPTPDGS